MESSTNRTHGRGRGRPRLGPAIAVAALIHLQLLVLVGLTAYLTAPRDADLARLQADSIDISTLDEAQSREIAAELDRQKEEQKQEQEDEKKELETPTSPGQVVEVPTPTDETRPRNARFAAERDSSVEKEMHRKASAERAASAAPRPPMLAMRAPRPPSPPSGSPAAPGAPAASPPGQDPESEASAPPGEEPLPGTGARPTPPGQPTPPSLLPTPQTVARALAGGTPDYLPDVEEGEETALNARKWKFASFFNRVKEQIRQHWHAAEEYRKRDPTGSVYGARPHYTLLEVELKPDGSLADVHLQKPSGVDFLDDVAVDAVKDAQPFPNPPQQLVDPAARLIRFRFGFVLDAEGGGPRLKVFRYSSM